MLPHLVAEFTQVKAMARLAGHSAAADAGACHNFTIDWISMMLAAGGQVSDELAQQRMRKLSARNGAGNPVLQAAFTRRWAEGGSSYRVADQMMIALRQLKEVGMSFDYSAFNQPTLVAAVKRPTGEGLIYSFWFHGAVVGAGGGAHTIGFFRPLAARGGSLSPSSDHVSCFDPNFGECYVPGIEFNYWFNQLKPLYGGNFHHHMLKVVTAKG